MEALENDGWEIIYDPLFVPAEGSASLYIDLGAERFIGAKKGEEKIAVEIKSFNQLNLIPDYYRALGQILVYGLALEKVDVTWQLFLAMSDVAYGRIKEVPVFVEALEFIKVNLVIFNDYNKKIILWKK